MALIGDDLREAVDEYRHAERVLLDASKETKDDPEKQKLVSPVAPLFKAMQERDKNYKFEISKPGKIDRQFAISEMKGLADDMLRIAFEIRKLLNALN